MARVTVEDVVKAVPNRFEMIILAAARARELAQGADPVVTRDHDKNTIVALRELASDNLDRTALAERASKRLISGFDLDAEDEGDVPDTLEAVIITEKEDAED